MIWLSVDLPIIPKRIVYYLGTRIQISDRLAALFDASTWMDVNMYGYITS